VIRLVAMAAPSTESQNKAFVRRWFEEVWNQGREDLIDEMRAPDAVATGLGESVAESRGTREFKIFYRNLRAAFPDLRVTVEDIVAENDKVAVRITLEGTHIGDALGVPPTGNRVRYGGITMARIAGGKIVEAWNNLDQLALLQQVGALPANLGPDRFLTRR